MRLPGRVSTIVEALSRALLVALVAATVWLAVALLDPLPRVSMTVWVEHDGLARIYHSNEDGRFHEFQSRHWLIDGSEWQTLSTRLPGFRRIEAVRLDPVNEPGLIRLESVVLESRWARIALRGEALAAALFGVNQLERLDAAGDSLQWQAIGTDPHMRLALPRALYLPDLRRTTLELARIALPVLLLWLLVEAGNAAFGRRRLALRRLPETLGRLAAERPARLILILTVVIWPLLLATQFQTARLTPFFQGPDETPHTANAFAGFDRIWGAGEAECNQYWVDLFAVYDVTLQLVRRPMVALSDADVDALEQIAAASRWDPGGVALITPPHTSCGSDKWFFNTGYNLIAGPLSLVKPDFTAIDYLVWLRHGQSLLAGLFALLTVLVLARGRFVLADRLPINANPLRVWLFLAVVGYLCIPQYLFLSSVVTHAAYLVPPALFVAVSFLFRLRWLTPIGLALAAFAFIPRRAAYAAMIVLLLAWYLALWLERRVQWRWALHGVVAGLVVAALCIPAVLVWLHGIRDALPLPFPDDMLILQDSGHYFRELWALTVMLWSGDVYNWGSFFGQFGWLDTPLPGSGVQAYRAMLWAVIALCGAAFVLRIHAVRKAAPIRRSGIARGSSSAVMQRVINSPLTGPLLLALIAVPLMISIASYMVFELRWRPRYAWGQTVQGRYFLPLFVYPILSLFAVHAALLAWRWQAVSARYREVGLNLLLVLVTQAVTLGFLILLMLNTLAVRYFDNPDVMARYLQLLR